MLKLSFKTEKFDLNCKVTIYAECQYDQEQEVVKMIQIIFAMYVVVNVTKFGEGICYAYFGIKCSDQDKAWASHKVCHSCVESLQ